MLKKKKRIEEDGFTLGSDLVSVGIQCLQESMPGRRKYLPSGDGCKGLIDGGRVQRASCASVITELAVLFFVFFFLTRIVLVFVSALVTELHVF